MCAAVKRIGFVSTRFAGTDGVSLETFKWVQVLERNGFECYAFAGEMETPPEHSFPEPLAHFSHPEILAIHERLFGHMCRPPEVSRRIQEIKDYLKSRLYEFRRQYELDLLIPENVLAIPMHIPFGMAITEFLAETGMPCVAHHHDFSWERDRFIINCVEDYLSYAFPPALSNVRHVVINTAASRQLSYRRGISNLIIPNVFDFETEPKCRGDRCKALRDEVGLDDGDLFVLQPTRIVPRKQIERAIDLGTRPETRIRIVTPVIRMTKEEIVRRGLELNAPFHLTWSCYQREDLACGVCDSCHRRLEAFRAVGVPDPIPYASQPE